MADQSSTARHSRRGQQSSQSIPGLNHSRRSYTAPGEMHVILETSSYASPGFAFSSGGGNTFDPFESMLRPTRSNTFAGNGAAGLLGGALGLLGNMASLHAQQQRAVNDSRRQPQRTVYVDDADESDSSQDSESSEYDEDLAYGTANRSGGQSRSVLGKIKDRLLDGSKLDKKREGPDVRTAPVRDERHCARDRRRLQRDGPNVDSRGSQRNQRYRSPVSSEDGESAAFSDSRFNRQERSERNRSRQVDMVEALERAAEHEKHEYLRAKKRFQYASGRTMINSVYIQQQLDEVKRCERAWQEANDSLEHALRKQRRTRPETQTRPSASRRQSSRTDSGEGVREQGLPADFGGFFTTPTPHQDQVFQTFDPFDRFDPFGHHRAFERFFAQMESNFGIRDDMNGFTFTSSSTGGMPKPQAYTSSNFGGNSNSNTRPQRPFAFAATPSQPPPPPSNPLGPGEAKTLFKTYNDHWTTSPASSPSIMYPTRTLAPAALSDPATISRAAVHTWSAEQVMQANTQFFFVLACGLQPIISDLGIVQFNRRTATEADLAMLVSVLKKEKVRWHSDRLGRRNGGAVDAGVNEALQRDERARAVFHGVVGLMEYALGRS